MLNVELVGELPLDVDLAAAVFFSGEEPSLSLPRELVEMAVRKPKCRVVESTLQREGHFTPYIAARVAPKEGRGGLEEAGSALARAAEGYRASSIALDIRPLGLSGLDLLAGFLLASYRFSRYKSEQPEEVLLPKRLFLVAGDLAQVEPSLKRLLAALEGVYYARDLTSEPPNLLPPVAYGERLKELEALGVEVEILRRGELQEIGMSALLAAAAGSESEPAVAILRWPGSPAASGDAGLAPLAFVGKGVSFDSGGLCLKPVAQQYEMKWDKAGAGAVAGVIKALALGKAKRPAVGLLGLIENMPDGRAMKPGDLIHTLAGKRVEIVNTDAEGRLVLADCLFYAVKRFSPEVIVDLGTLTVETIASLGAAYAALYSNDAPLAAALKSAGERCGERLWELPMGGYFAKQIESDVGDIKNVGIDLSGENGAAAEFLRCFIDEGSGVRWAHLDIAGVSWTKEELPLARKGCTGFGVRLLLDWYYALS